jgi:hypothetical protein
MTFKGLTFVPFQLRTKAPHTLFSVGIDAGQPFSDAPHVIIQFAPLISSEKREDVLIQEANQEVKNPPGSRLYRLGAVR